MVKPCRDASRLYKMNNAMTKDKSQNWKILLCCGIFIWLIINLLQGIFTEIHEDEAYYALYGEHLAWGYFDHPPMVGLMTFLSSIFFSGSLGVRFFTIIASCLSLWVMWRIAQVPEPVEGPTCKHVFLFLVLSFSIVMFNIYGFVTTPDVGLILFSTLFLLVYQRYLEESTWLRALLMGLLIACMVYSKYHAFMLLGLIVLSNLKLLKDGKFWVACFVALALLTPHILWQVNNDFPSFKYHLSQRSEPFRWSYFLEYLPNQLLIFNPFTFGAIVYVLCIDSRHRTSLRWNDMHSKLVFERGLKFIFIGFFFFFWLMAFRGHVEPHWTIVCCIPVVVLLYRKALVDNKLMKYVKCFILPSLLLVLAFRILLMTTLVDRFGYHGKETYYKAVEKVAGDSPVVFQGSFQQPALYHYFTGKESSSLRAFYDRKTQFDLWQFDTAWIDQSVFICGPVLNLSKKFDVDNQRVEGYLMQHFQSPNRLVTDFKIVGLNDAEPFTVYHNDTLQVDFSIYNPLDKPIDFQHNEMTISLVAQYLVTNDFCYCFYDEDIRIEPHSCYTGHLHTVVSDDIPTGKNRFVIGLGDGVSMFNTEENQIGVMVLEKNQ